MMKAPAPEVEIEVEVLGETEKAYKITTGDDPCWIPKSLCFLQPATRETPTMLTMPEWLALERGLI